MTTAYRHDGPVDFTDLFSGAGGFTAGFTEAGYHGRLSANHDQVAVSTHRANFPHIEHWCEDINQMDKRRLPRTRILIGSPICTEISPAGGRKRTSKKEVRGQAAMEFEDGEHAKPETFERTRATALDILAATDCNRYDAVVFENVIEFALDWDLFDWWLQGFRVIGYNVQVFCATSSHLEGEGNEAAPQDRDRVYGVITREGIPLPDLTVSPRALCPECGPVHAVQVWRNPRRPKIGKHGVQYDYRCPNRTCGHLILDPSVRPVAEIIDWTLKGTRIADGRPDRKKFTPYAASTRARVQVGLDRFGVDPHLAILRRHATAVPLTGAVPAVSAQGRHHALIIPNGRKGAPRTTDQPLTTVATKPHHSLVQPAPTVDDCTLRMLHTDELKQVQRFTRGYIVNGNQEERILQIGNAVSVNAAHWIAERLMRVLA